MPKLLLVMPSAHPGMTVVGEDGVVVVVAVVVAAEADVVVEEGVIERETMTVMPKRREKESK